MRIRSDQIAAFQQSAVSAFEEELVAHMREFSPSHCDALGPHAVHQIVRLGMKRAQTLGFTLRGPTRLYLESMFMFGTDFDTDPMLPWAGEILRDRADVGEMARANHLYTKVREYAEVVLGPGNVHAWRAVRTLSAIRAESPPQLSHGFEAKLLARLREVYPEKCNYIGEQALLALMERARQEALARSMDTTLGRAMFVVLMFVLGHGCAADPQYPWITAALGNPPSGQLDTRTERLRFRSIQFMDHVLARKAEV